jgi:Aldo/keto reductase family
MLNRIYPRTVKRQKIFQKLNKLISFDPEGVEDQSGRRDDSINQEKDRIYSLKSKKIIEGHATSQGTFHYTQRNKDKVPYGNFNIAETSQGPLHMSKLGYGTYIGDPSTLHDKQVFNAIINSCLTGGVNIIDTAINYRYMKAERVVGAAILELINTHGFMREELFIASKGGYLTVRIF